MTQESPILGSMDRPRAAARRRIWPLIVFGLVLVAAISIAAARPRALPSVERSSLVIDEVTRGPFVQEVAAAGALVAEQPRLISAPAAGRIRRIEVEPGDRLTTDQVILELENPDVVLQLLEVEQQIAVALADLADLSATLQVRSLGSENDLRRSAFESTDARRQSDATSKLAEEGLISDLEALRQNERSEELAERVVTDRLRHAAIERSARAQIEAQQNRLEQLRDLHAFHRSLVERLTVRAPSQTTAREILVQQGEWVTEGQRLVSLVEPGRLKAVLQVPEAAAHALKIGQPVTMNARGTELRGTVSRLAAAVQDGTLAAEVRLEGDLPAAARPDLSVEGRIEISRSSVALSVGRPVSAVAGDSTHLYIVDGSSARRAEVRLGLASTDRIEIASGAAAGDRLVIAGLDGRTEPAIRLD